MKSFGNKEKVVSTWFKFPFSRYLHLWGHNQLIFNAT